jgi:hypothetical protein
MMIKINLIPKIFLIIVFLKYCLLKILKAKYDVIEPYYMEGTTPDEPVLFSGSSTISVK